MSRCGRCGNGECNVTAAGSPEAALVAAVACRDRELANLRSLLRSVTGKLEEAAELTHYNSTARRVEALINQVLEVLS